MYIYVYIYTDRYIFMYLDRYIYGPNGFAAEAWSERELVDLRYICAYINTRNCVYICVYMYTYIQIDTYLCI